MPTRLIKRLAVHAGQQVGAEVAGDAVQRDQARLRISGGRMTGHGDDPLGAPPAERGRPAEHRIPERRAGLAVVAADQAVDDQRFEPGVPGAAHLGGGRVDLRGGEGELARVAQHRLA